MTATTLARAHARSGDAVAIGAYLGSGDAMDNALAEFAELYADQNELDYAALDAAVKNGNVKAQTGSSTRVMAVQDPLTLTAHDVPGAQHRLMLEFAGLPIAQAALRFARARHAGQRRENDQAAFIAHPIEVARLLCGDGQPDEIVAAGLLHDVLEKTATTSGEVQRRFGSRIARLVESVSDDPSLGDYTARKRALRDRVAHADPGGRAVFAADKIAKARELALLPRGQLSQPRNRAKLDHYCASLEMLRRVDGDVPLVHRLVDELSGLAARKVTAPIVAGPITSLPESGVLHRSQST